MVSVSDLKRSEPEVFSNLKRRYELFCKGERDKVTFTQFVDAVIITKLRDFCLYNK